MTTATTRWYHATQGATLVTADHHRERWTREDLDLVVAFGDDATNEELAVTCGRTLASIVNIKHRLTYEGVEGVWATMSAPPPPPVCSDHFVALLPSGDCPFD